MTVLLVGYVLVALVCWRLFAGAFAWWDAEPNPPTNDTWLGAVFVGLLGATIWPLVLIGAYMLLPAVRLTVRSPLVIGAERRARRAKRERQLQDLEREAGL